MTPEWHNWSGSVTARPAHIARPRTRAELADIVQQAKQVRVAGAGHSFMPLCATEGVLLQLAELDSPLEIAADGHSAWAPAGWSLKRVTQALWDLGYSLPNQGDVNPQSLAGAIATGTHGTGADLGSLATFARAFELMLADGSLIECSGDQHAELFQAQRLSLGLLGVAVRIRVDVMPRFYLEERIQRWPLAAALERFAATAQAHRHAEFFVFPYADAVILKTLQPVADDGSFREPRASEETVFRCCCEVSRAMPTMTRPLQRQLMKLIQPSRRVGPAHRIFPSERTVAFEEMEYEVPRDTGLATLYEAIQWVRQRRLPVTFPFEFRWTAGDDIWLSPFNHGPCASISMHQYARMPWTDLFAQAEPVFRAAGGRPHWAKRHTWTSRDVFASYPQLERFLAVRRTVDPDTKFTNEHLAQLFAIGAPAS
jgi:FAD-linked oxidoreductase